MDAMIPLHALFSQMRDPENFVCHDGNRYIRWHEFQARIAGIAAVMKTRPEIRWALYNENTEHFAILLFALLHANKHIVIPPNAQPKTLAQLGKNAFDAIVDESWLHHSPSSMPLAPLRPTEAIIDLYTSGSTGTPKKIRKTLAQFENEVATLESLWGTAIDGTHVVATVPHHHIYGLLFRLFWPLSTGRTFDCITCTYPDMLNERLSFFKKTTLISSPAQLSRLPALLPLDSLPFKPRMIFSSGGPLTNTTASEIHRALNYAPTEIFGSTETGGIAWRKQGHDNAWTLFPRIAITQDNSGMPLLHSPFLPDDTPFKMDDAIALQEDGRFILGARLDRIVKIEEKRLSLPEMEARLLAHPWIAAAATIPLTGRRQIVGAAVVLSPEGTAKLQTAGRRDTIMVLRTHLAQSFEPVLLPKQWRFVEALPMTQRGKLSMREIASLFSLHNDRQKDDLILMPNIEHVKHQAEEDAVVHLTLHVPRGLTHFEGHFPGLPILPGIVQLDWAVRYARQYLKVNGNFKSVEHLRFQSIILPDTRLSLELSWNPTKSFIEFSYVKDQRKFSSGRIVMSEAT